jgi:hypothetical protein
MKKNTIPAGRNQRQQPVKGFWDWLYGGGWG